MFKYLMQNKPAPVCTGCGFHDIDSLESLVAYDDSGDAAIIDTLDALDDSGALDLLDTLTPADAERIARKLGA